VPQKTPVDLADHYSRKRAILFALMAAVLVLQAVLRQSGSSEVPSDRGVRGVLWCVTAVALLGVLATGGWLLRHRDVRGLLNDELSQSHRRTGIMAGFWAAMTAALGLYIVPAFGALSGRDAAYLIVTVGLVFSLLTFAYLEHRSEADE
jgi:hypothetical protein